MKKNPKSEKSIEYILKFILLGLLLIMILTLLLYLITGYYVDDKIILGTIWAFTGVNAVLSIINNLFPKEEAQKDKIIKEIKAELQNINSRMILVKVDEVKEETSNS